MFFFRPNLFISSDLGVVVDSVGDKADGPRAKVGVAGRLWNPGCHGETRFGMHSHIVKDEAFLESE